LRVAAEDELSCRSAVAQADHDEGRLDGLGGVHDVLQAQVLRIAASLAGDEPVVLGQVVAGLDEPNAVAVAAAVLRAAGLGARPVLVGGGGEGRGRW
jgi:hypothetical protein